MVFNIVVTGLWIVNCVAGQLSYPGSHGFVTPWNGRVSSYTPLGPVAVPFDSKSQYHFQDGFGSGKYGHTEPTSSHHASHDAYGNKAGEFSYVKPDGTIHKTRYIADALGYRVESNDLPVGPAHSLKKRSAYPYAGEPSVSQSGYLADTPEVAAAKASHFQEHAKRGNYHMAAAYTPTPAPYSTWPAPAAVHQQQQPVLNAAAYTPTPAPYSTWPAPAAVHQQQQPVVNSAASWPSSFSVWPTTVGKQQGGVTPYSFGAAPYASWPTPQVAGWPTNTYSSSHQQAGYPVVTPDGYLKDTPEVAQAKAAHFAEKAKVVKYNDYPYEVKAQPDPYNYYSAQTSSVPVNYGVNQYVASARSGYAPVTPEGQVTDTPEVNAAKVSHFAEYAAALARNAGGEGGHVASVPQQYSFPNTYSHASGVPSETPEVAQARAAHFSEYARVANRLKRSTPYGRYPASTGPLTEHALPVGHPFVTPYPLSSVPHSLPFVNSFHQSSVLHSPFAA